MIHLITLAPAIDNFITIKEIKENETNYSEEQNLKIGGKAVNVAEVLFNLDLQAKLVTTTDNFFKNIMSENLKSLNYELIETEKIRVNTKIRIGEKITELNSRGQELTENARKEFLNYVHEKIKEDDHVLIAGNPHPKDYNYLINLLSEVRTKTEYLYLDISHIELADLKQLKPYFIKPNIQELCHLLGTEITLTSIKKFLPEIKKLARSVMISFGDEGIIYCTAGSFFYAEAIKGKVINTVGAGDSVVAAYIFSVSKNYTPEETLKICISAGSAKVFTENLPTLEEIVKIYNDVKIKKL